MELGVLSVWDRDARLIIVLVLVVVLVLERNGWSSLVNLISARLSRSDPLHIVAKSLNLARARGRLLVGFGGCYGWF